MRNIKARVMHSGGKYITQAPVVKAGVQIPEYDHRLRTGHDGIQLSHAVRPFPAPAHRRFRVCGGECDLASRIAWSARCVAGVRIDGDGGNICRMNIQERRNPPGRFGA